MWFSSDVIKNKLEDALSVLLETWPSSSSTAYVTAVGFWGLVSGRVSLTCAFSLQMFLLASHLLLSSRRKLSSGNCWVSILCSSVTPTAVKVRCFLQGLTFQLAAAWRERQAELLIPFSVDYQFALWFPLLKMKRYHAAPQRSLIHL